MLMLPGLNPAHTRSSFHNASSPESGGARLSIERIIQSPSDFLVAQTTGLWLLPPSVAERDVTQDIAHADWLIAELERQETAEIHRLRYQRIARILGRSSVDEVGCVTGGLRGKQTPDITVIEIADFEMRAASNNTPDEVTHISLCGNEDCYNSRHHNLDYGGSRRDLVRVELNPFWYRFREDGRIETIWGDELPSVEESLRYFIEFQRSQYPFVPYGEGLTATPISQVAFHPLTGCWEAYMYEKNTAGLVNIKNGYGVMYARQAPNEVDQVTGEVKKGYRRGSVLAHNLIWTASGRQLTADLDRNHLCNYTRCCNPLHIEEIDPEANRSHGHAARAKIRELERSDPSVKTTMLSKAKLAELYVPLRQRYSEIVSELDR